jgi:glycosyltransferase involved in cell wall biosynthesis
MSGAAAFIMPHYSDALSETRELCRRAVDGVRGQSDKEWILIIIDDGSPDPGVREFLNAIRLSDPRIHVLFQECNRGQGVCRNIGVQNVAASGCPFVLFVDADDVCHPRWLDAVRREMSDDHVDVVYTTLVPVDGDGREVPVSRVIPSIRQIMESHSDPPQGRDAWVRIVTEFGYVNLTSATAVRTGLAVRFPFPEERISEDSHTWLRYSAGGGCFRFVPNTPVRYRVSVGDAGSSSREQAGGKRRFYEELVRVDGDGFEQAARLAKEAGRLGVEQLKEIRVRYYLRLAETMRREGQAELMRRLLRQAIAVSPEVAAHEIQGFPGLVALEPAR